MAGNDPAEGGPEGLHDFHGRRRSALGRTHKQHWVSFAFRARHVALGQVWDSRAVVHGDVQAGLGVGREGQVLVRSRRVGKIIFEAETC